MSSTKRSMYRIQSITLLAWLLSACQMTPLNVHYALSEGFSEQYQSVRISSLNKPENPKIKEIIKAIENNMTEKGYELKDNADLLIVFNVRLTEGSQLNLNQIPYQGNAVTLPSLEAVYEAELLVNAIDVLDESVVWKAFTTKDIRNIDVKKVDQTRLSQRVTEIFESFPERVKD